MDTAPIARCRGKPHGIIVEPEVWEVKCDSRICGAGPGLVVLHRFSSRTGELLETQKFATLETRTNGRKEVKDGTHHDSVALRAP